MPKSIEILMATYNGSAYLKEQIDSILNQDYSFLRLIIRDDASTDDTPKILQEYMQKFPDKITVLPSHKRLGVKENFSCLMSHSQANYVMFADQDDFWLPNKIRITFEMMQQMELKYGKEIPLLIHTDLKVVDENLNLIADSFWKYANLFPKTSHSLNRLLGQNVVTGCTVLMNRSLVELASPIPSETLMHDWWLALNAAAFGQIGYVQESTILYRQHGKNTLGAQKFCSKTWLINGEKKSLYNQLSYKKRNQVIVLFSHSKPLFNDYQKNMLIAYIDLHKNTFFKKRYLILKYQFFKNGFFRNCAQLIMPD